MNVRIHTIAFVACLLFFSNVNQSLMGQEKTVKNDMNSTAGLSALQLTLDMIASPRTTLSERVSFLKNLREETIQGRISKPLTHETEKEWSNAFWAAGLIRERTALVRNALAQAFLTWEKRGASFQRAALEATAGLFPCDFSSEMRAILGKTNNPKLFAMATYYLDKITTMPEERSAFVSLIENTFPEWGENPILFMLHHDLSKPRTETIKNRPPLLSLLSFSFKPGCPVLFSIQRLDRRYPGIAVVRGVNGAFIRQRDGSLFNVSHLALSLSNMPGTITNGNTPQGVFTVRGTGYARNVFIGPTPYLHSKIPFEASPAEFFHDSTFRDKDWSPDLYELLLPEDWRTYIPIWETFYAGKAGRSAMLTHGTTINPAYYQGEPCYPHTPSLGCLCAKEFWSPETGRAVMSDHLALLKAFLKDGNPCGFLVVVEIDDQKRPVTIDDIIIEILAAEQIRIGKK